MPEKHWDLRHDLVLIRRGKSQRRYGLYDEDKLLVYMEGRTSPSPPSLLLSHGWRGAASYLGQYTWF